MVVADQDGEHHEELHSTGRRRNAACRLGWQHVRDGRLRYRRKKTERTMARLIDIPIHPELAAVLDTVPRDRLTFLETNRGAARSPNGLGNAMRRWCDLAGLPECTSHGLRKACAGRHRTKSPL
jgi:integrase